MPLTLSSVSLTMYCSWSEWWFQDEQQDHRVAIRCCQGCIFLVQSGSMVIELIEKWLVIQKALKF